MRSIRPVVAVLAAVSLVLTGCGRDGAKERSAQEVPTGSVPGDVGDLAPVCGPGTPTGASAQGVTDRTITVGVFTDFGFAKNPEFIDAAEVFTSWCNDHGGIAGRRIEADILDTNLTAVRQRMREACRDDFALVGGGTGLDGLGVKDRLDCLLPSFPAQISQSGSVAADLEISASPSILPRHDVYTGFRQWLVKEGYPQSIDKVGIIDADSPITKVQGNKTEESLRAQGATVVYRDLYPIAGVSNWAPYAQTIKERQVRGLVFNGEPAQLPKLEAALTEIGYSPDWIDATNNNYTPSFLRALGRSLEFQNNVVDLSGVAPFEASSTVPALRRIQDMFARYAPGTEMTFPQLRAISAWLLFAKSAAACGDRLTRRCVHDAARSETSWTAGGLHAPVNTSDRELPIRCFDIERATPKGWVAADFRPDSGLYRCDVEQYRFTGDYGAPMTLADVGKSMTDLK